MELKQAQLKMKELCLANAEAVIAKAIEFKPSISDTIAEVRKAQGPLAGVAGIACREALRGTTPEESAANIIKFAESLA